MSVLSASLGVMSLGHLPTLTVSRALRKLLYQDQANDFGSWYNGVNCIQSIKVGNP